MIRRELTFREKQLYEMISGEDFKTFNDIVEEIRRDLEDHRFDTRKELKRFNGAS